MAKTKVLIIDDDKDIIETTGALLEYEGFDVSSAETVDAGIAMISEIAPDIVVLDIMFPEKKTKGFDAAAQIKSLHPDLPILAFTAINREYAFDFAKEDIQAEEFVNKPVETKRLVGTKLPAFPGPDAPPEELVAYRKALGFSEAPTPEEVGRFRRIAGVPETPQGYLNGISRSDVVLAGYDEEAETSFLTAMHSAGTPPPMVHAALKWYWDYLGDQYRAMDREEAATNQELRRDWGPDFAANLGTAKRAVTAYGGQQLLDLFDAKGIGAHPFIAKAFAAIGRDLMEHGAMPATGIAHMTPEEAQERAKSLQADLLKVPTNSDRAKELINQIIAVTKIAEGGRGR